MRGGRTPHPPPPRLKTQRGMVQKADRRARSYKVPSAQPSHARAPTCSRNWVAATASLEHAPAEPSLRALQGSELRDADGHFHGGCTLGLGIVNWSTFGSACTHAPKTNPPFFACQVRSEAQTAGAERDERMRNRSDHQVDERTKLSIRRARSRRQSYCDRLVEAPTRDDPRN